MSRRKNRSAKGRTAPADATLRIRPAQTRPYATAAVCGLLLLAVFAVFGQTANHEFINFDDDEYVYANRHVSAGLTAEATAWALTAYHAANWHPLTWLSHALDCQLYDLKPGGHHLTNVFLHAAAAIFLFLAIKRMTGVLWPSACVAAIFAIHPLRVESVAWVAERKDVLSGLFFMLTLWFYARYTERPESWGRYVLVLVSFALGLAVKPMLVTLPLVLLLLDYWPLRRVGGASAGRRVGPDRVASADPLRGCPVPGPTLQIPAPRFPLPLLIEKIPLFTLAAASCLITLAAQRSVGAVQSLEQLAFLSRVAHAAVAYVAYLGQIFYPAGLAVLYPRQQGTLPAWEVAAAVSVLLAISMAVFLARRKCPYLLCGWLWYLGTLVPVIGLVQVGRQTMADRYTYLTQIGLYMAIAWGAVDLASRRPYRRWLFAGVSMPVLAGLMVCAWHQTGYWRDSAALWAHTAACTTQNPAALTNYGMALADRGQFDEAIARFREALEIEPGFDRAHLNLASALAACGQVDEAIVQYRQALAINPNFLRPQCSFGHILADRGQLEEAIIHFQKALEIDPRCVDARYNLGLALARLGHIEEAIFHFRQAVEIMPDYAPAHFNLGMALDDRGQAAEALAHYEKALDLAIARHDVGLATAIQARLRLRQSPAPTGKAP